MTNKEECLEAYNNFVREKEIGDLVFTTPEPPKPKDIVNFGKPREKRKFPYYKENIELPNGGTVRYENSLSDTEYEELVYQEQDRLDNGLFFFNGDQLEYVTGFHYIGLQWFIVPDADKGESKKPQFVDAQRDAFYHWQWCYENPTLGAIWGTCRRFGKALDIETPIPTPNGFKSMKDIISGDIVFDENGKECNVTYATEIQHNRNVNRVWFDDDTYLDADDNHQWEVSTYNCRRGRGGKKKGSSIVMTTKEIKESPLRVYNERNFHIKMSEAVKYSTKELPIDPYLFGYWLGDGSSYGSEIFIGDEDLDDFLLKLNYRGLEYSLKRDKTCNTIRILGGEGRDEDSGRFLYSRNSFLNKLKELDVIKYTKEDGEKKHIPKVYKLSSLEQRRQLVRGLMDSDGSINKNGTNIENTQKNRRISEDLAEVLRSLGEKCRVEKRLSKMNRKDGSVYNCDTYRVSTTTRFNPFSLERKRDRWHFPKSKRNRIKSIEKIELLDSIPVKCISVDSPNSLFLAGKSYTVTHNTLMGIVIAYIIAISKFNSRVAIQSKTMPDAEGIFGKMQEYWQKMPAFLKPTDTGDTRVKNKLVFAEPKKRSSKGDVKEYGVQLNSSIFAVPSKEVALDGQRLTFGYFDEEGKSPDIDVNDRWSINSKCFLARANVVGKSLHTSTVEDMEKKGGENFKKIWDKSDGKTHNDTINRTASGLRRLFVPADYGFNINEFGYSDREGARKYHEAAMGLLTGEDLISYRRQYPLEEADMWLMNNDGCQFSEPRLYQQSKWNDDNEIQSRIRTGNLFWKNGIRYSGVVFDDDPKGKFNIATMPQPEHQNKFTLLEDQRRPTCPYFRMGVDPTDHKAPVSGKGSNNAAYVVAMPSTLGFKRITPVAQYLYRHDSPNDFYEDMMLLSAFYSCPVLPENNKYGLINYFEDKGGKYFIMNDPTEKDPRKKSQKFGMASTGEGVRATLLGRAQSYVVESVGYISGTGTVGDFPFQELIDCMLDFAPSSTDSRWTKWDEVVAFMFALAACDADFRVIDAQQQAFNLDNLLTYYKRS